MKFTIMTFISILDRPLERNATYIQIAIIREYLFLNWFVVRHFKRSIDIFHMSVREPYAEFWGFFVTRSRFRDGRKHVLFFLLLFYKSNVLLLL